MATVSKRQQARNERELQELIRIVPGNNQCADCGARNPGWASWSLGVFLCMRCASIHRKLGTHISKVKSLTMDTWSSDQVESMKRNGNTAVNKIYNPKNKRPDIPLDADEVDSAMERFLRKKYQGKSLGDDNPQPLSHGSMEGEMSRSPESSPPPPLPPKKGKFFGFGLRAHSSAHPLSKHDKKSLPKEPRVDGPFRVSSENYDIAPGRSNKPELTEEEMRAKLAILRDMGFTDERRNTTVLRGLKGDIDRTVEALVKIQQVTTADNATRIPAGRPPIDSSFPAPVPPSNAASQFPAASANPFDQQTPDQNFGISFNGAPQQPQHATQSSVAPSNQRVMSATNPFDTQTPSQIDRGLSQAFQGMQISNPLFPHSTGGYPVQPPLAQDPRFQHSMTPPVPLVPHQYSYMPSPSAMNNTTNPFFQSMQAPHGGNSNPYVTITRSPPPLSTSSNPFFGQASTMTQPQSFGQVSQPATQSSYGSQASFNPFGIPPSQSSSPPQHRFPLQTQSVYDQQAPAFTQSESTAASFASFASFAQNQPHRQDSFPNFQYGQPQFQQQQPLFQPPPQPHLQHQSQQQFQPQFSSSQQPQYQAQGLLPQQTGRVDKSSILALYNYPHLAPQLPNQLASIPEPSDASQQQQSTMLQQQQVLTNPMPTPDFFSTGTPQPQSGKRAVTMPTTMHSAGVVGNRNPFLNMGNSGSSTPTQNSGPFGGGAGTRHTSAESVQLNNAALESGRHSPDAFASLSARYTRA